MLTVNKEKIKEKLTAKNIILFSAAAIVVTALCIWLIPFVLSLRNLEKQREFQEFISSLGIFGVVLMLLIQTLQVIVAIIPGEPVEVIAGAMYGTFGGLLLILLGIFIGETAVFLLVRKFGKGFIDKFVNSEKFERLRFLHEPAKRDSMIFILFFIPGTPKDILTYFAPLTDIRFVRFIILSTLARVPSVVSSTYVGATLSEGSLLKSAIIFAVTGIIGIAGIFINDKILNSKNKGI